MFITAVILIIFWSIFFNILFFRNTWEGVKIKKVVLQPGMNVDEISKLLFEKNIITKSTEFKLAVRILGKQNQLYAGTYYVKKGMSNLELAKLFSSPDYFSLGGKGKITFPEGYRIKQMAALLQRDFDMSEEKFLKETENDSLINLIGLSGKIKNLEGFLFPDTYIIPNDADEQKMVKILFDNFLSQVYYNQEIQEYTQENPQRLLNLIILASIVQAETAIPEEYPIIAGVYLNRLKKNIKLQADPTIQYILPDGPRRLLNKDYKIDSPYNTYIHNGLPPGPINNPGLEAIRACINPAEHDYYFFVAKKDKSHKFSKTYEEHLQAINEIRGNQ
ncbi:MAG: endolytic transglycosylase MltG [Ignavibacteria bacterium]|nr:endolytic transglycosylase MltG [Ignavibacteria bacterium]